MRQNLWEGYSFDMECGVVYGPTGCLAISIPSGNVQLSVKGGRKCFPNGFVEINGAYYASCSEKAVVDVIGNNKIHTIALLELCPVLKNFRSSMLIAGSVSGKIYFWNTFNGSLLLTFKSHSKAISCIDFDKSFNTILIGSADSSLKLFCQPLIGAKEVATLYGHLGPITNCCNLIGCDYNFDFISISEDSTIKFWKLERKQEEIKIFLLYNISLKDKPSTLLKGLNDFLYITLKDSTILKIDLNSDFSEGNLDKVSKNYHNFTECIQLSESCEGYHLISIGVDGIRFWDSHSITCLFHFNMPGEYNSILSTRLKTTLTTKTPLKRRVIDENYLILLNMDKETAKESATRSQTSLEELLPQSTTSQNLSLITHLNLFNDSEQLYKLIQPQIIEVSKQMESLEAFKEISKNL